MRHHIEKIPGIKHLTSRFDRDVFGFGGIKIITDRAATYANRFLVIFQTALLVNLSVLGGVDLVQYAWVGILGLLAFIGLVIFDLLIIYPQEINFRDTRSDVMGGTKKKVEELDKKVDTLIAEIQELKKCR